MDAEAIRRIPLSRFDGDFWAWTGEKHGLYSVKSAYRMMAGVSIIGKTIPKTGRHARVQVIAGFGRSFGKVKFLRRLEFSGGGFQTSSYHPRLISIGATSNHHVGLSQRPHSML
jgi:hypothetical protein